MESDQPQRSLILLPPTKEQRMLRIKDAWEKLQQTEQKSTIDLDVKRATLLAEALAEEGGDEKIDHKDLGEATGLSNQRISQLLRYHRLLLFSVSIDPTAVGSTIPEFRFRAYWKQLSDAQDVRHVMHDVTKRDAYERRVFRTIVEWLDAGKEPLKVHKPPKHPTVEQMFTKKKPLSALRKEVERRFTDEFKPLAATLRDYLGRDRSTYAPSLMADAAIKLEKWQHSMEELLREFDNYATK